MSAHLLAQSFRPNIGLNYSSLDELWHVDSIVGWNYTNTVSVVYAQISGRQINDVVAELNGAVITNVVLHKYISPTDAIVHVQGRTNHSSVYRFRTGSINGYTSTMLVPYWAKTITASGKTVWVPKEHPEPREGFRRIFTSYVRNGSLTDTTIDQIQRLTGTVVLFPDNSGGIPYMMKSPSISDYAPGQSRLVYIFETMCPVRPMPAGTLPGQDLAIPGLDYLQDWYAPIGAVSNVPLPIQVRPWQARFDRTFQSSIPFLNT